MIKAVIFDCFGVLTTDGWKQIREEYLIGNESLLQQADDIDRAVNVGLISHDKFTEEISRLSGLTLIEVRKRLNVSAPNKMLFEYIRDSLKPKLKIGLLSNAANNWLDELFEPWQVQLLDEIVLSYQLGVVKPDPIIYQAIVDRLGVLSEECIFVDDQLRYCQGAEQIGMKAIYHKDTNETILKIKELINA